MNDENTPVDAGTDAATPVDGTPVATALTQGLDAVQLRRVVEAALLAANQPMGLRQLAGLFPEGEAPGDDALRRAIGELMEACEDRGVELVEVASGFRYQVRREVYPWVSRLWTERQTRYGRAVLETLALIAYRQPITRGEIEQVRGVAVNTNIIRTLEERDWIRVVGHRDVPGKPALLGTTRGFLDYFGLRSLDQLPPLAELRDIPDLEPELPFDAARAPAVAQVAAPGGAGEDNDTPPEASGTDEPPGPDDSDTPTHPEEEAGAPVDDDAADRPEHNTP